MLNSKRIKILLIISFLFEGVLLMIMLRNAMQINSLVLKEYDKIAVPRVFQSKHHKALRDICEIEEILDRIEELESQ